MNDLYLCYDRIAQNYVAWKANIFIEQNGTLKRKYVQISVKLGIKNY